MLSEIDRRYLQQAIELARHARANDNHPFGAVLVDRDGNLLLKAENTVVTSRDCTGHAETNLMRLASQWFDRAFLATCTIYTSTEPCAMCAGAIHWAGVGRVVYALSEARLYELIGSHPRNETMRLPCREVFARCDRSIIVVGPVMEDEAAEVHQGFWTH
ncbi:MAG: nucleoside deaminase [Cyanobacteria bacterium]|nr:nucleoside deaminase [Cyanobacteriota bacterium]MDW8201570.1 nucleoside deaminase [Cyanobacteriota bacterium SKYGB_h_bin112]